MPYTARQERYLHAHNIQHSHDYENMPHPLKGKGNLFERRMHEEFKLRQFIGKGEYQIDKKKGAKNTYIVTKFTHRKRTIRIGNKIYVLS